MWLKRGILFLSLLYSAVNIHGFLAGNVLSMTRMSKSTQFPSNLLLTYKKSFIRRYESIESFEPIESVKGASGIGKESKAKFVYNMAKIRQCIAVYKDIYGDLEIPADFVIPAKAPWPTALQKFKFGSQLQLLLASYGTVGLSDDIRELYRLGFEKLIDSWTIIIDAARRFKEIYGHLRVPVKFVVPDSDQWPRHCRLLKLGSRMSSIRISLMYVLNHPERKLDLDALGFEWRKPSAEVAEDTRFRILYDALTHYKQYIGDIDNISPSFVVPMDNDVSVSPDEARSEDTVSWPPHTLGCRLGHEVAMLRSERSIAGRNDTRSKMLNDLGLTPWAKDSPRPVKSRVLIDFDVVITALNIYKDLYGNVVVPQSFVVPETPAWPVDCWGLLLGKAIKRIQIDNPFKNDLDKMQALKDAGLNFDIPMPTPKIAPSVVKSSLVIPKEESEPVRKIEIDQRRKSTIDDGDDFRALSELKSLMKELGSENEFNPVNMFDPSIYAESTAKALRDYKYNREFSSDPVIRNNAHFEGYLSPQEFGSLVNTALISDEDLVAMQRVGYKILEFGRYNWNIFIAALRTFKLAYGHTNVDLDYRIDESKIVENIGFNRSFLGFELGHAVHAVRSGDVDGLDDEMRRKQLDEIGFQWGDLSKYQHYRFIPMFLGLRIYAYLYGFSNPPASFKVPSGPQWPHWMTGMPLGEWVQAAISQQDLLRNVYPDRFDLLSDFGLIWWLPSWSRSEYRAARTTK